MDLRALWDQRLDTAPEDWQRAARNVGDALSLAGSMLRHECGLGKGELDQRAAVMLASQILDQRAELAMAEEG